MRIRLVLLSALAAAAALFALAPARAAIVIYTSEAAFTAATTGLTNIDFDGIAAPGGFASFGGGPLVLSGVTFTADGTIFVIDPAFYGSSYPQGGFLTSDFAGDGVNTLVAALPGAVTAIGADFGGLFEPASFTITLSDGSVFPAASLSSITGTNSLDFIGVTSTIPLTSITFDMPDATAYNAIDNFRFGSAPTATAAVPEPGTLALLLFGTLTTGAGFLRRRKRTGAA